jgi:putative oxidoreductase
MSYAARTRYSALMLRVALGVVFVAHAGLKWFAFTLPGTAAFFVAHGFPGWTAYPVFLAELLGGVALVLGVGTRWVALGLVPVMLGALTVHWPNGWSFTAPDGGWEYVAFLLVALVAQAGLGDGALSLGARRGGENESHAGRLESGVRARDDREGMAA